ncbi:MAG: sensor histidine kinase [Acidimicrobiia bacterium]
MASLPELVRTHTDLSFDALVHLQNLVTSWQLLADMRFADLLLLAPIAGEEGGRFVVLAQVRPTTGQTLYPHDMIGLVVDESARSLVTRAWRHGEILEGDTDVLGRSDRARVQAIPVGFEGERVAMLLRESTPDSGRRMGELERAYFDVFDRFAMMISEGRFPFGRDEVVEPDDAPRVSDGVIILEGDQRVRFASPNAMSSLHRIGIHASTTGMRLSEIGLEDSVVESAFHLQAPVVEEIERGDNSILLRAIPLLEGARVVGAVLVLRDVSELRRRDRLLLSKDATIREIHHRVKNNLQTIAALLRLQGRRLQSPEAQAAIKESERRIRSIAIVHETLARDSAPIVAFNDVIRPLVRIVEETVATEEGGIRFDVEGDAGDLPGEVATPLAVVLNELMQNAVDHAFASEDGVSVSGHVCIVLRREGDELLVDVRDDGKGLPPGFMLERAKGLGLSIVHALVTGELAGTISAENNADGPGAVVHLRVPVAAPRTESELR